MTLRRLGSKVPPQGLNHRNRRQRCSFGVHHPRAGADAGVDLGLGKLALFAAKPAFGTDRDGDTILGFLVNLVRVENRDACNSQGNRRHPR